MGFAAGVGFTVGAGLAGDGLAGAGFVPARLGATFLEVVLASAASCGAGLIAAGWAADGLLETGVGVALGLVLVFPIGARIADKCRRSQEELS